MNLIIFGIFVLFLVAIQFTGGKTVDEVIEKYIRALGGTEKLGTIKSIFFEGLITITGSTLLIKIYQFKESISLEGYTIHWQISDFADNQYQTSQSTSSIQLLDRKIIECLTQLSTTAHLINYIAAHSKVLLIGKELVEENACNKIVLTTNSGMEIVYWFNSSDGLLHQTTIKANKNSTAKIEGMQIKYDEYRLVEDILIAHKIEIFLPANATIIEVNFNKIIINEPLEVNFVNTYNQP